jgi:hypothetical protein
LENHDSTGAHHLAAVAIVYVGPSAQTILASDPGMRYSQEVTPPTGPGPIRDRLEAALSGRYAIEHELATAGRATVDLWPAQTSAPFLSVVPGWVAQSKRPVDQANRR